MILTGKGGVGTSTVTAVMALGAFRAGLRVLVADMSGSQRWSQLLPGLDVQPLVARDLLEEYLADRKMGVIARRLRSSGVLEVVATAAPGIEELVVLGKVKQLERAGQWDLILVDAPASGHAVQMLTTAEGVTASVMSGPLRTQAAEVREMLGDPARCMVMLVTLPEDTPITETIETAFALEDRVGVQLGPVVVNRVASAEGSAFEVPVRQDADPALVELAAAMRFWVERHQAQSLRCERLAAALPLAQIHLPEVLVDALTADDLEVLAAPLSAHFAAAFARRRESSHGP